MPHSYRPLSSADPARINLRTHDRTVISFPCCGWIQQVFAFWKWATKPHLTCCDPPPRPAWVCDHESREREREWCVCVGGGGGGGRGSVYSMSQPSATEADLLPCRWGNTKQSRVPSHSQPASRWFCSLLLTNPSAADSTMQPQSSDRECDLPACLSAVSGSKRLR